MENVKILLIDDNLIELNGIRGVWVKRPKNWVQLLLLPFVSFLTLS